MTSEPKILMLPLEKIKADLKGVSARANHPPEVIAEYAERMKEGDDFPAAVVCFDDAEGTTWLADGFLRYLAARQAKIKAIACEVRSGGQRAAKLHAAGANKAHGQRRTPADIRLAVLRILNDSEWSKWPLAQIAQHVGVTAALVKGLRVRLEKQPEAAVEDLAATPVLANGGGKDMPQTPAAVFVPPTTAPAKEKPSPTPAPMLSLAGAIPTGQASRLNPLPSRAPDAEDDADDEDEDTPPPPSFEARADAIEDRVILEERCRRALRKVERFARALGMTLAEAVTWYEAGRQRTTTSAE